MPEGAVDRVLARIHEKVNNGAYYEAQQMYKTIFHRYQAKKSYEDSHRILEEGALLQLRKGQVACGVELGTMLIETSNKNQEGSQMPSYKQVYALLCGLPSRSDSDLSPDSAEIAECSRFVAKAAKWSRKLGKPEISNMFHSKAAGFVWSWHEWKGMPEVLLYYTKAQNWIDAAKVVSFTCHWCNPNEEELFLTRSILQVLFWAPEGEMDGYINGAKMIMGTFMRIRAKGPLDKPLVNFISLFLQALERKSKKLVALLKAKYSPSLERDPNLSAWVSKVEGRVFGEEQKGLMDGLLKMFMAPEVGEN